VRIFSARWRGVCGLSAMEREDKNVGALRPVG
jgi:hypothetical protein